MTTKEIQKDIVQILAEDPLSSVENAHAGFIWGRGNTEDEKQL